MSLTLTYFGLGARGFVSRVCARAAGVPFTDTRLTFPEWGAIKEEGKTPLGQLPVLSIEGSGDFCQSIPISKYCAQIAGLYPTTPLEQLKADEVVAISDELWNKIGSTDKGAPETRVKYGEEVAPKYLTLLEQRLAAAGGKFFHGETPGFADLWVYQYCAFFSSGFFDYVPLDFISKAAPAIWDHMQRVKASELYQKFGTPE